jgi:hypothetical protein
MTIYQLTSVNIDKSSSLCPKTENAISDPTFRSSIIKPFLNNPLIFTTYTQVESQWRDEIKGFVNGPKKTIRK